MNKKEFIATLSEETELAKKDVELVVNTFIETVTNTEENIKLTGFGAFEVRDVAPRECKNPQTGEPMLAPAYQKVVFKPSKNLKRI